MWMKTNGCGRNGVNLLGLHFPPDGTPVETKEFDASDLRFLAQQNVRPCEAPEVAELEPEPEAPEEDTSDPREDDDSVRSRAKDAGIKHYWVKSIDKLKEEMSGD